MGYASRLGAIDLSGVGYATRRSRIINSSEGGNYATGRMPAKDMH